MQIKAATEEAQRAAKEREKGAKHSVRLDEMMDKVRRFSAFKKKSGRCNSFSSTRERLATRKMNTNYRNTDSILYRMMPVMIKGHS